MAIPFQQAAFTLGELAPGLYGRQDLARYKVGASTQRNMFSKYSGGAYSRAGTAFTGFSKQTGSDFPPRLVSFQFSINQGLVLEFGNNYLRIISDGAYVTEGGLAITNITQASPAVVSIAASGATSATPINTAVTVSYAPGDLVTVAGGVGSPAVLSIDTTEVHALDLAFQKLQLAARELRNELIHADQNILADGLDTGSVNADPRRGDIIPLHTGNDAFGHAAGVCVGCGFEAHHITPRRL
jgi:hypothetical protein